ncbi:sialyltransferase [Chloropicon primus]|uniref:Sialyltransferase n=1 Tax=Chloropicon primus TaxID=1764295 RepID=A0A5B8MP76_9CHLO|nr:sialyltransferase [Chloropicon primus]UPR01435.1 sialyltransferase [Chloropicon primus]|eukprot:QDZ22217.1 sialyltransferase [Chloropicon primus]
MFGTQEVKGNSRSPWRAVRPYVVVILILGLCSTVILLSWRNASLVANGARPRNSRSRQRRERHREKERIDKSSVDFRNISDSIIAQLSIPKTKVYKHKFPNGSRLVVNKKNPENRLAHTQQEKFPSNLPATDIEERFGSCAVVGNSGISLFNEKQGESIDKHDLVIRFNDGPTTGFEKYVGKRTSYRFINNNWSRIFTKREPRGCAEGALISFGNGALRFLHALRAKYGERRPAYFMAPEFALNARGTYKKAYAVMDEAGYIRVKGRNSPPTGIEGVFFGLEMCDTVDLYGFQIRNDPKIKYHYHNEVQGVEAAHSFGFQYEFLKVLTHGGFIQVCLPETKSGPCINGGKNEPKARAAQDARRGGQEQAQEAEVAEHTEDVEEAEEVGEVEEVHEIEESGDDVEMAEEVHEAEEEEVVLE